MEETIIDNAWIEKYRPKKVDDVIGDFKVEIKALLKTPSSIPHLLFYSKSPGTGKSSLSHAIINELGCDKCIINSSDERKIEVIREKIKDFVRTKSSNNKRRCVFLDEVDGMTYQSMDALRNMMETYASNALFILTCNHIEKVNEAVRNRCNEIQFTTPKKEDIKTRLIYICKEENLKYDDKGISKIIDLYYPSIRGMIQLLQKYHLQGKEITEESIKKSGDEYSEFWDLLRRQKYSDIKKKIFVENIDYHGLLQYSVDEIIRNPLDLKQELKILSILADLDKDLRGSAIPKHQVLNSMVKIMLVFKNNT